MKKKYIYLISETPHNVIRSQIFEYAELLKERSLVFDFIFCLSISDYQKGRTKFKSVKKEIKEKIGGHTWFIPSFRRKNDYGVLTATVILFFLLIPLYKYKLVFHARGGFSANIVSKLKKLRKNIHYIFDVRGDSEAEFRFGLLNNKDISNINQIMKKFTSEERNIAINSDHLFCVSKKLNDTLVNRWGIPENKFSVIPCVADSTKFYYTQKLRDEYRSRIKVEDKVVFVYAGGIGLWHNTTKMFELFSLISSEITNSYFIVLTPAVEQAIKLSVTYGIGDTSFIHNARREEVPNYLMASDWGVLLRERDPLNEVASPTKFAEYVMAGLQILISDFIGDYSDFVKHNRIGIVTANNEPDTILPELRRLISQTNLSDRKRIAELGKNNFSKERYIDIVEHVYSNLFV